MRHRYHLLVIQLVIIVCFNNLHNAAALNGQQVRPVEANEQLSFVASLAYDNIELTPAQNHFCTGILITRQHVLTARICLAYLAAAAPSVIYVGCTSLQSCQKYHWESWTSYGTWAIINKRTDDILDNDVAVIKLKEKVTDVPLAELHSSTSLIKPGTELYMAGWGHLRDGIRPNNIQKVSVKVLPREQCESKTHDFVPRGFYDWNRKICTRAGAKSKYALLSREDTGGPIYDKEYRVVGINLGMNVVMEDGLDDVSPIDRVNIHETVMFYIDFLSSFSGV